MISSPVLSGHVTGKIAFPLLDDVSNGAPGQVIMCEGGMEGRLLNSECLG